MGILILEIAVGVIYAFTSAAFAAGVPVKTWGEHSFLFSTEFYVQVCTEKRGEECVSPLKCRMGRSDLVVPLDECDSSATSAHCSGKKSVTLKCNGHTFVSTISGFQAWNPNPGAPIDENYNSIDVSITSDNLEAGYELQLSKFGELTKETKLRGPFISESNSEIPEINYSPVFLIGPAKEN